MEPVGEGAIRVRTGRSDIRAQGSEATLDGAGVGLSTGLPRLASVGGFLAGQVEAQTGRLALWAPVALGSGAAAYLGLSREPLSVLAFAAGLAAVCAGLAARAAPRRWMAAALFLLAFGVAGFALAKLRVERVAAPVMRSADAPHRLEGWVVDVQSPDASRPRLLIAPVRVEGVDPAATPIRVRVRLQQGEATPAPGSPVAVLALLNAPPPPSAPGSYDFARDAYFDSIGAVGFALAVRAPPVLDPPPAGLARTMAVNAMRWRLAERIVGALGPETGGLAAAMVTGHEHWIPAEQIEAMRNSGLAHIISISGLHMAIVGGFAFGLTRLVVAAWPWLALRVSGKKAAACAGLAAVGAYLLLSGAPAPAERAAITAAIAFTAILADRRAISLHALAVAAVVIIAVQPEAVAGPGFQMSFAATAALVALAEAWRRPAREINAPWQIRLAQGTGAWIAASVGASLVAGLATAPFAVQHFNRVAAWGLAANLAVAPISSFVIMPFLAMGAALAPFGLGDWALTVAGWGVGAMTWVAHKAAATPGAIWLIASAPAWTLPAAFLGVLWLCLWRGPLRWLGLPLALAVWLVPRPPVPDLWIAADGSAAAVRQGDSGLLLRPDAQAFSAELWARRRGLEPDAESAAALYVCDRFSCLPQRTAPVPVAANWRRRPLTDAELLRLCASAKVVIVRSEGDASLCPGRLVLTKRDFAQGGSAELWRKTDGWTVQWAQPLRGRRPWTWSVNGSGE